MGRFQTTEKIAQHQIEEIEEENYMKRRILLIILCATMVFLVSCGNKAPRKTREAVKADAQELTNAFATADMETINKLIFKKELQKSQDFSTEGELDATTGSQDGILKYIFPYVSVNVTGSTDTTVDYEIKSPDMLGVFDHIDGDVSTITEEELRQHIVDYVQTTQTMVTELTLNYELINGEPVVDFENEAFLNAVTGGLMDAYKTIYEAMMVEYLERVK